MKYYSYNTFSFKEDGSIDDYVVTLSEEEIIKVYWDYWQEKMIFKYGKEYFQANFSEKDCIEDWIVVNWAWEHK
jgi:hypothetical protein